MSEQSIKKVFEDIMHDAKNTDYHYLAFKVDAKLNLLDKFFINNPEFDGVSVILEEIMKDVAKLSEFCKKTENFTGDMQDFHLNLSPRPQKTNQVVGSPDNLLHRKVM